MVPRMGKFFFSTATVPVLLTLGACGSLRQDLGKAEAAYTDARYEHALVWLLEVEPRVSELGYHARTRFYFTLGMTEYRMQRRDDAYYHLNLAKELSDEYRRALGDDSKTVMTRTLNLLESGGAAQEETFRSLDSEEPSRGDDSAGQGDNLEQAREKQPAGAERGDVSEPEPPPFE